MDYVLVFDLGGTVFTKGKQAFINLLTKKTGKSKQTIIDIIDSPLAADWRKNKIPKRKYWLQVKKDLNVSESIPSLEKMWFEQYKPIDEVKNLIDELHRRYKLAYISNNMKERISYLEKHYNFSAWFDDGLCSYEIGALKSDIKLYQTLLTHFPKIPPNQFLFIDDNEENHTYPEKLGCEFLPFTDIKNLRQSLRKKSILPVK